MAARRPHGSTLEMTHYLPASADSLPADDIEIPVQPAPDLAVLRHVHRGTSSTYSSRQTRSSRCSPGSPSKLETLPVEIVNQILSYFTHPRSRLPGLTEAQSAHDFPRQAKSEIKSKEDLTRPPDSDRWAADLFSWHLLSHPFNVLSLTSKRCHALIESYCSHLVRSCNGTMFNLPFAQLDQYGSKCVHPDLSGIVYRRLWLQHAPRRCIYCSAVLDCYPFPLVKRVIAACQDCFYRQTLTVEEVERQYHISPATIRASPQIRTKPGSVWVLRIDVESLALRLYGTRAFHNAHVQQMGKPCSICAITRFIPTQSRLSKSKSSQKTARPLASLKKKVTKRSTR